ncbi:hypothetical protein [Sporichthya sp.]|uniref:hypothetical protein n=1 Tax=Sporichthya sp. TaxID=65475 RepID=UPI0017AA6B4E|nr:hypothetical protein [Sporichthya sp.]MBA3744638.1 hypothetical protein [Sporichthya sp.]
MPALPGTVPGARVGACGVLVGAAGGAPSSLATKAERADLNSRPAPLPAGFTAPSRARLLGPWRADVPAAGTCGLDRVHFRADGTWAANDNPKLVGGRGRSDERAVDEHRQPRQYGIGLLRQR